MSKAKHLTSAIVILAVGAGLGYAASTMSSDESAERAAGYAPGVPVQIAATTGASLDQRIASVEKIIHAMPKNGMNDVRKIFSDLQPVKKIAKDSNENLSMGMSEESWAYSPAYDMTVVVCEMLNTPAHIFRGKKMSDSELEMTKKMMKEMIDMMK